MTNRKTKPLRFPTMLCMVIFLGGCAEIQFVTHTFKRINNHFDTPQQSETISHPQEQIADPGPDRFSMSQSNVMEMQALLTGQGFNTEGIDGIFGPKTRKAVRDYQISADIPPDGTPSMELLVELRKNNGI